MMEMEEARWSDKRKNSPGGMDTFCRNRTGIRGMAGFHQNGLPEGPKTIIFTYDTYFLTWNHIVVTRSVTLASNPSLIWALIKEAGCSDYHHPTTAWARDQPEYDNCAVTGRARKVLVGA